MSPPPAPIPHEQAQQRLLAMAPPLGPESIPAEMATGRALASPLSALRTQPAADLSAMDGYGVRIEDPAGPWRVVGESAAGHPFAGTLAPGQAIRVSTGAVLPAGAGAIVLQEHAIRQGETLRLIGEDLPSPLHIRRQGFDFRAGDRLLEAGTRLGPAQMALAISAGHRRLAVGRRPALAVLDTGDELAADPANPLPHQIPASNGAMLAAMAASLASRTLRIGPVADDRRALIAALERCEEADVVVTSGGASVGDHDLLRPALEDWGAQIAFWRIAMKPGKPLLVARRGPQIVLGLPGNPVSSFVTAFLFLLPLLRKLGGASAPLPEPLFLPLSAAAPATGPRAEFVRGVIEPQGVRPLGEQDSSALAALARAGCLIARPALAGPAPAGSLAMVYLLPQGMG